MNLELSIIISQIIAFLVMLWILKKFAWKPFLKVLADRKAKIQDEFASLEAQKKNLQNLSEAYEQKLSLIHEEGKKIIQEAIDKGQLVAEQISKAASDQAKATLEKVKSAIDQEIADAHKKIKNNLVDIVIDSTEKLLREKVDSDQDRRKIAEFIEKANLHAE